MRNESEDTEEAKEAEGAEKKPEASEAAVEEAAAIEKVTEEETKEELKAEAKEEAKEIIEAEKEEKIRKPEKKEIEEEIVEERVYTIPLSRAWISPRRKRAPRAMRLIKSFIERHMKMRGEGSEEEREEVKRLVISNDVNEKVWRRGIQKPPRKIRVRVTEDKEGTVTVYLAEGD